MRINQWIGVWVQYRDSARPVITLNQVPYAFNNEARECLVSRTDHLQYFLETGQYRIAGIEVADAVSAPAAPTPTVTTPERTPPPAPPVRGQPPRTQPKGRR